MYNHTHWPTLWFKNNMGLPPEQFDLYDKFFQACSINIKKCSEAWFHHISVEKKSINYTRIILDSVFKNKVNSLCILQPFFKNAFK